MPKRDKTPLCLRAALHYAAPDNFAWKLFCARMEVTKSGATKKYSWLSKAHAPGGENWGMTNDLEQLEKNFNNPRWRDVCGIGLPTGADNEVFVIEYDTVKGHGVDGGKALKALEKANGKLPLTLMSQSPTGSVHRLYRHPGPHVKLKSMSIAAGVDVKADGGMVILPPSVRHDGKYKWLNDEPIADPPQWLIDLVEDKDRPAVRNGNGHDPDDPWKHAIYDPLSEAKIIEGCEIVAADLANEDDDWDEWNRKGMKLYATAPDDHGFAAFDGYSQRSDKYDADATRAKWDAFFRSPPTQFTQGSFIALVHEADPDWEQYEDPFKKADTPDTEEAPPDTDRPAEDWSKKPKQKTDSSAPKASGKDMGPPVDLWDSFPTPELPRGLLPKLIEDYAFAHSEQMGSDPSGLAMGALVACAAVIPDRIQIQPLRHNQAFTQSARLWVSLVGRVSALKSPIFRVAMAAIKRIDKELWHEHKKKKDAWEQLDPKEKKATPEPRQARLKIEDATIESIQEIAADSPDGLVMTRDELSGFFGSMEQYSGRRGGSNPARGFYLQAYDGGGYMFDRVKRGSQYIENLSINIFGGIQPDVIRDIAWTGSDDGLIERLINIVLRKGGVDQDVPLTPQARKYDDLINRLYQLRKYSSDAIIQYNDAALAIREEVRDKHKELMDIFESANRRMASHVGKYNGMFYRLCLLWHVIEHHEDNWQAPIDADTARRVQRFMHEFMLPHAVSFYFGVLNVGEEHDRLVSIAGYILAHKITEVSNRDVQRSLRTFRKLQRKDIEGVFEQLHALNWLDRLPPKRAGDPPRWTVNPVVHELHKDRAAEETKQRARVRELIKDSVLKRRKEQHENSRRQQ